MADGFVVDRFHRALNTRLMEEIAERMTNLAGGSGAQSMGETISTAEKYAAQVAYIKAFNDVLGICEQIDKDMNARPSEAAAAAE